VQSLDYPDRSDEEKISALEIEFRGIDRIVGKVPTRAGVVSTLDAEWKDR
jgi:hypothetical protein